MNSYNKAKFNELHDYYGFQSAATNSSCLIINLGIITRIDLIGEESRNEIVLLYGLYNELCY